MAILVPHLSSIFELSAAWGKLPVHAKSTPGFIVNRVARPYYAEALALLQEGAATPEQIDAALRGAGFRMGPCELMDLIGHDTNLAVTRSVYEANFFDKRYQPSVVQAEPVAGGLLGRKSGRGFYRYPEGAPPLPPTAVPTGAPSRVTVLGAGAASHALAERARAAGWSPTHGADEGPAGIEIDGMLLLMTDGRMAVEVACDMQRAEVAVFDRVLAPATVAATPLAFAVSAESLRPRAAAWLAALGFVPLPVADTPGLVVARTVGMLVNEAADAVQQGVCSEAGADDAMKSGVNHPAGPFEFLARWSVPQVVRLLEALDRHHRGERYRVSPWLRHRLLSMQVGAHTGQRSP